MALYHKMNAENIAHKVKILKDATIAVSLIMLLIIICKTFLTVKIEESYDKDNCIKINFDDIAYGTRCRQNVEIHNLKNNRTKHFSSSVAQALALSSRELADNQILLFQGLLKNHGIRLNDTHVIIKQLKLALNFKTFNDEFAILGGLLDG